MATKIRLARAGAKKQPFYKVVVADSRSPRDGKFIEKLGTFNPLLAQDNANRLVLNAQRVQYWLGAGATPSERVENFLVAANLMKRSAHSQKVLDARIKVSTAAKKKKAAEEAAAKKAEEEAKRAEEKAAAEAAKAAASEQPAAE
jgi:small subunit ribosomal protein S16